MPFIDWEVSQENQDIRTWRRNQENRGQPNEYKVDPEYGLSYSEQYAAKKPEGLKERGADHIRENVPYHERYARTQDKRRRQERTNRGVPSSHQSQEPDYQELWVQL